MPELPEVETIKNGIAPHIENKLIKKVIVRNNKLRWPVPNNLNKILSNTKINSVSRRAKYIVINTNKGNLIIHLGMSGTLRVLDLKEPIKKHDHVDFIFNNIVLRYNDPRRFGAVLFTDEPLETYQVFSHLGPEPFDKVFTGKFLYNLAKNKKGPVKNLIMDNKIVVGIGNIYAAESLFQIGVHPETPAKNISLEKYTELAKFSKKLLKLAIKNGGTTLKDFTSASGKPGYFQQKLKVYGREGESCVNCNSIIQNVRVGQRSSCFCPLCQKL
jgi:formamidopyrimidine-DNA glycosylase